MSCVLKVDYREQHIIKQIQQQKEYDTLNYSIENLPIGDFIICKKKVQLDQEVQMDQEVQLDREVQMDQEVQLDQEVQVDSGERDSIKVNELNVENDELIFIIERKTISDLCASITDARFREQKTRLLNSVKDPYKIIYIIEGSKKIARLSKKIVDSALLNLVFKHHYHVLFTTDIQDTIDTIKLLYEKVNTNVIDYHLNNITNSNNTIEKISSGKLLKKSESIQNNVFIHQLAIIPGVSIEIAKKIQLLYPNMTSLLLVLEKDIYALKDIHLTPKRKLGKKLSEKIYTSFYI